MKPTTKQLLSGATLLALLVTAVPLPARATRSRAGFPTLPVHVHVARVGGRPVITTDRIAGQVQIANRVFARTRVSFRWTSEEMLGEEHTHLETRTDRHQLARELRDYVVNVFVVASMRDVDDPTQMRRGVHWRSLRNPDDHYVIVVASSPQTTLAHELGHFFGNHQHSAVPGNIMSYQHGPEPSFDDDQARRVYRTAADLLDRRLLVPAPWIEAIVRRRFLAMNGRALGERDVALPGVISATP